MFKKIISIILLIAFSGCVTTEKISFREFSDDLPDIVEKVITKKDTLVANSKVYIITDTSLVLYRTGKLPLTVRKNEIDSVVVSKPDNGSTFLIGVLLLITIFAIFAASTADLSGNLVNTDISFH